MANDFKVGDFVNWKYGDGKPDHIVSFGWQHQTVFLSRQPKTGVPVTELTAAVVANNSAEAWKPEPPVQSGTAKPVAPAGEWHPDPPKAHTGIQRG